LVADGEKNPAFDPSLLRARDAGYKKRLAFAEIYNARLKAGATENSGCQQNSHPNADTSR
jgi:hypothetical protein